MSAQEFVEPFFDAEIFKIVSPWNRGMKLVIETF